MAPVARKTHPLALWIRGQNLTQREVAKRAGLDPGRLAEVFGGRRRTCFSQGDAEKLAAASGLDILLLTTPWRG